jgi:hypothetical protein
VPKTFLVLSSRSIGFAAFRSLSGATTMHLVAQYRQFAADYRRLAATLTKPADKQAMELFAIGWDKVAKNREAMLRSKKPPAGSWIRSRTHVVTRHPEGDW